MKTCQTMFYFLSTIILVSQFSIIASSKAQNLLKGAKSSQGEDLLVSQMFKGDSKEACSNDPAVAAANRSKVAEQDKAENGSKKGKKGGKDDKQYLRATKTDLWWVKSWGFGPSAYFFDYLNPVLKDTFVNDCQTILKELKAIPNDKFGSYKDPFDYSNFLNSEMTDEEKNKLLSNPALINSNYVKEIFENSINAVQLKVAMPKFKWFMDKSFDDPAKAFVQQYDSDGDGRLNPREIILGVIDYNKSILGTPSPKNLFGETMKKISAIYSFIDCNNDGFVSAEELWNNLKNLNRPVTGYNIYNIAPELRVVSVNDFILKSHEARTGLLNKTEFFTGILYGLWNRQITKKEILKDDSKSLASLRWQGNGQTDKILNQALKKKNSK